MDMPALSEPYVFNRGDRSRLVDIHNCLETAWIAEIGVSNMSLPTLQAVTSAPDFGFEDNVVFITDSDDDVVAAEVLEHAEPHVSIHSYGAVAPEHTGRGLGSALLEWARRRAVDLQSLAPPETEVTHRVYFNEQYAPGAALVTGAGYETKRYYMTMAIEFDAEPDPPAIPDGIELRPIRVGIDDEAAALAADEAFKDHYGHAPRSPETVIKRFKHWLSEDETDTTLWWVACDGDEIAGHCWAWSYGDARPEYGYVASLGVRRPWRGRGVARALLRNTFHQLHERGLPGVELGVDASSPTGAVRLYESVGMNTILMSAEAHKTIREGVDITTG